MGFQGQFDGKDTATNTKLRIRLDSETADLTLGGAGRGGDIKLNDDNGVNKIRLNAGGAEAPAVEALTETILLSGDTGTISLIRKGVPDNLRVAGIMLSAVGDVSVGSSDVSDFVWLKTKDGKPRIHLDADGGNIWLGGNNVNGDLLLLPVVASGVHEANQATVRLDANDGSIRLGNPKLDKNGKLIEVNTTVKLNGAHGNIKAGGQTGSEGDLELCNQEGATHIHLDAGKGGAVSEMTTVHVDGVNGNLTLGRTGTDPMVAAKLMQLGKAAEIIKGINGDIMIRNAQGDVSIRLDGETGDITLANNDCAEDFDVLESEALSPGNGSRHR